MKELAFLFLRLGTIAFGGPAAHIAMMEDEFVRRRAWLSREQFLDLVGASALIPGPSSTEVAIFIGYRRAGARGLLLAGLCFILPAALMVTAIAWAYVRFGRLPVAANTLYGVKAVVLAIVAQAVLAFAHTAIKSKGLLAIAIGVAAANALGAPPMLAIVAGGVASVAASAPPRSNNASKAVAAALFGPGALGGSVALATPAGLAKLFFIFLKIGAVVFGSGYVLLAFLRADFVEPTRLTEAQLVDAVAVGQLTPGPVFTTATFIGYLVAGLPGAVVATVAIFLPSFVLVAISGPIVPRLRRSRVAGAFLDGVNVASLAIMAVVGVQLGRAAIVDLTTAILAVVSGVALVRWRMNSAWLVIAGGVVGNIARTI